VRGRVAAFALAFVVALACGTAGRAAPTPTHQIAAASPAATAIIDVTDMMGVSAATFFVVEKSDVRAIALQNHATRYTIPTSGKDVQVATAGANAGNRVYVLDQTADGARLRLFAVDSGSELASRVIGAASVVSTGIGHGALAIDDTTGVGYMLLREQNGIVPRSFDWFTLESAGSALPPMTCPSRLLAGGGRVAVVCMKEGLVVAWDGGTTSKPGAPFAFAGVAMLSDGTLVAAAEDGRIARLARTKTSFDYDNTLKDYGAKLIPDGVAANSSCCFYYGIVDPQANDVQIRTIAGGPMLVVFPSISQPVGGLFVQPPFAYFVIGGRARHVDIQQGFGEIMADLGEGALPGAVANR